MTTTQINELRNYRTQELVYKAAWEEFTTGERHSPYFSVLASRNGWAGAHAAVEFELDELRNEYMAYVVAKSAA